MLRAALYYAATFKWHVHPLCLPIPGKCGHRPQKHNDDQAGKVPILDDWPDVATTDERRITGWWRRQPQSNVGVACGEKSGVVVLDIDPAHGGDKSLAELIGRHGRLPTTVEAITGSGGSHYYFQRVVGLGNRTGVRPGIDFKAERGQVVAPPSRHASGGVYQWADGRAPGQVDLAQMPDWLLDLLGDRRKAPPDGVLDNSAAGFFSFAPSGTQKAQENAGQRRERNEHAEDGGNKPGAVFRSETVEAVEAAIKATLPAAPGQRHRLVFEFRRALKAIPVLADAAGDSLLGYVQLWHHRALPFISTQPFEETWIDFLNAWPRVKYAAGESPLHTVMAAARLAPLPPAAARYEQAEFKLLVALCRELQRHAGPGDWWLSCRTAANLLGLQDHKKAWRWLWLLVHDRVIAVSQPGDRQTRKATCYRYLGDTT